MTKPLLLLLALLSGQVLAEEGRLELPGDEPPPRMAEDDTRASPLGWDQPSGPRPGEGRRGGYGRGFEQRYGAGFGRDHGPAGRGFSSDYGSAGRSFGGGGMGGGHGRR